MPTANFQENLNLEMAKPGKDGLEKTPEECVETFTMILKGEQITKNTFLRNAGILKTMSKSRSLDVMVLEEDVQRERATADVLRIQVDMLRSRLESCDALLVEAKHFHDSLKKTKTMPEIIGDEP